jgi:predicted nucleotidyltransferase
MTTVHVPSIRASSGLAQTLGALRASRAVRLDDAEISALAAALDGVSASSVELFGSRTDPTARGGDIDILILSDAPRLETARRVSSRFFTHCEERIDVVVLDPTRVSAAEEAFLRSLRRVRIA